jgi:hypothetical protein
MNDYTHCENTSRTLREHCENTARTLLEHCENTARTLREHCLTPLDTVLSRIYNKSEKDHCVQLMPKMTTTAVYLPTWSYLFSNGFLLLQHCSILHCLQINPSPSEMIYLVIFTQFGNKNIRKGRNIRAFFIIGTFSFVLQKIHHLCHQECPEDPHHLRVELAQD